MHEDVASCRAVAIVCPSQCLTRALSLDNNMIVRSHCTAEKEAQNPKQNRVEFKFRGS